MKKWNRPAMHFPACLKWIRSAGLKGYEKSKKNKRNLGDSDGWKEESGQNRENGMQGKWKSHGDGYRDRISTGRKAADSWERVGQC